MSTFPKIPDIPEAERTPTVVTLLEIIQLLREEIRELKDEVARLKGQKGRPTIRPSKLDESTQDKPKHEGEAGKRPGSAKRSKTADLTIHDIQTLKVENPPPGSLFKGYEEYTVQGLIIQSHNVLYRRERWETPEGDSVMAPLPKDVRDLCGAHYDHTLIAFVLSQYHHAHVTQPLILEQLLEFGIDMSAGQVSRIITEGHEAFHAEKDEILRAGLEGSGHVNVDDTGARHQGKNGFCTHIGNEWFAWFQSTESKSRINFLELLRAGSEDYVINDEALKYMGANKLPKAQLDLISGSVKTCFASEAEWNVALEAMGLTKPWHIRLATEGALMGSALAHGLHPDLVIISDDAGQFNIRLHGLCWVHAERLIHKLVGFSNEQRAALEDIRTQIWDFYKELKAYKQDPHPEKKVVLEARFHEIFTQQTCFAILNLALGRIHANKAELLLVLERPDIPLHNNTSERDIREYVKKRKISGGTRSDAGRRCRDTFVSLKKTCRKLGVSFWQFLSDRLRKAGEIPPLPDIIRLRAAEAL